MSIALKLLSNEERQMKLLVKKKSLKALKTVKQLNGQQTKVIAGGTDGIITSKMPTDGIE
ncbi:hypothetical protein [Pseudoalteromonas rubra]|uniref:hypothetical protein n=1 Tax=Pseudoalteromonas rubra TaxID=43658 RepID=UPI000A8CCDF8|nr:hypothetical protein [Pseudoalteromonas rubra]